MREEQFATGDFVHVYNRGNRKMPIVYDENDRWRFLKILRYFNDEYSSPNIFRDLYELRQVRHYKPFMWPESWPEHKPLVKILSFCLMPNHFHLLLEEIKEQGISRFMAKLGVGFTRYMNLKHSEVGRVFQGTYKGKVIKEMEHLQYLNVYIQILNPLEILTNEADLPLRDFDKAFNLTMGYKFGSLPDYFDRRDFSIIDSDVFKKMLPTDTDGYKEFAYDAIATKGLKEILGKLTID